LPCRNYTKIAAHVAANDWMGEVMNIFPKVCRIDPVANRGITDALTIKNICAHDSATAYEESAAPAGEKRKSRG